LCKKYNKCIIIICVNHPKKDHQGRFFSTQVHSDEMVLRTVRWDLKNRLPKELKSKLTKGEPSGSSPLRSDDSHDDQVGDWAS
jgi:hypothetical protein